jgi:hypothetical protein
MSRTGPVEWLLPYYWAAVLDAPTASMTWWGWAGPPPREPTADDRRAELTAPDLELVRVVCEVLVEPANCAICSAPLDGAINVDFTGGFFTASRIVVATRCQGWRRHRHVANVIERAGETRFAQLGLDHSH